MCYVVWCGLPIITTPSDFILVGDGHFIMILSYEVQHLQCAATIVCLEGIDVGWPLGWPVGWPVGKLKGREVKREE